MPLDKFSVLSSLIWKFLEKGSYQLILFIVTLVLARLLTPDDYGTVAIVLVLVNLATVFVEGGLSTALIQKKECSQADYSTIFYFCLLISSALYILLWFSSPLISSFFDKPELIWIIRILSITLFFNAINSVQRAYLSRNMLFKKLFYSSIVGVSVSAILGIGMAYVGFGIWSLVAQQLSMSFFITLVMWFTVRWRPTIEFSKDSFHKLFGFGWKILLTNLSISLFVNIRSLIIGKYYSSSSLAYFDKGKQFPSLIMDNINSAIQQVMFPVLSHAQSDRLAVREMVRRSTTVSSYVITPLLVMLAVMAKPLTIILLTEKWIEIVPFIQIFCLANIFMPIQNVNMEAIKSLGYSDVTLKLEIIKKIIEITILIVSVFIGVEAIAWGVVIYNFICVFLNLAPCNNIFGYSLIEQLRDNMSSLLLSVVLFLSIIWIPKIISGSFIQVILICVLGTLVYIISSIITRDASFEYITKHMLKK